jgi:hypothetical protein
MILGTANFENLYKDSILGKEECFELLEYFENNGGKIVQTADDYGDSQKIIWKYIKEKNSKLIMLFKINELGLLCINENKVGHSIYYPHELNCHDKIIIIPDSNIFDSYLPVMKLHSKIYARSHFMILKQHHANIEYIDDYIIGVESMEELKRDMELFHV